MLDLSKTFFIEQRDIIVKIVTSNFQEDGWEVETLFDGDSCGYQRRKPQPCIILGFKKKA